MIPSWKARYTSYDLEAKTAKISYYGEDKKLIKQIELPMTEEKLAKAEANKKQRELENSPEYIKEQLFSRAKRMNLELTYHDMVDKYSTTYEDVYLQGTAKDLSYILGILNDEIH